ncbi:MAG: hypothetical protein EKK41_16040 [Hyphomicrobiales bacterium]|nr:MAG: hypothetical protein EKK41_16040 [Hyphomicrobiales bacterium]
MSMAAAPTKSTAQRLGVLAFVLSAIAFVCASILWLPTHHIADLVVAPQFILAYIGLLALIVLYRLSVDGSTLRSERAAVERFLKRVADTPRVEGKAALVKGLTRERAGGQSSDAAGEQFTAQSDLLRKIALIVRQAGATEASKLYEQGVLPSAYALRSYGISTPYRGAATADLVIRIALLGTFVGIVAALTIASGGLTSGASGAGKLNEMQRVLQDLLASAAAKFWISAAGLAGAVVLLMFERYCLRSVSALADRLGALLDELLSEPEAARLLCKAEIGSTDPIRDQLLMIAEQIKASADQWVLTVKIGGAGASGVPTVSLGRPT